MTGIIRYGFFIIVAVVISLFIACAPNRAMTRSDGVAGHDFANANTQEDQRYAANDDFDVETEDVDSGNNSPAKGTRVSSTPKAHGTSASDSVVKGDRYYQTGIASWYGREFQGRKTASGEKFDMNELTAAHRTIPLGSVVLVKNLDNGKTVKVRINDRGPFKGKRILDLSYAAAKKIDMVGDGEARVGIKVLGAASQDYASDDSTVGDEEASGFIDDEQPVVPKKKTRIVEKSDETPGGISLQTGAFYTKRNAEKQKERIAGLLPDYSVTVTRDGDLYKVFVTGIRTSKEAERFKRELGRESIDAFVIEQN
jgi:rare lipoprotein A